MNSAANWLEYCANEMNRAKVFFGHGTDNAHDEAAWLLLHVLDAPLDGSFERWDTELNEHQRIVLKSLLERRIEDRWPLAYLTGEARFCGLDFIVTPDVLIPSSPLAELIPGGFSPWLDTQKENRVLDMCTGGGCIAVAMATYIPDALIDAVDICAAALEVASRNVKRHAIGERVRLVRSDLFTGLGSERYDLIISNPPYVAAEVFARLPAEYKAEPSNGLLCGEDGMDIVLKILDASTCHLQERGILIMELGESARTLAGLLPRVPFLWLEFQHGGSGVFLLEHDQLTACQPDIRTVLEQRVNV